MRCTLAALAALAAAVLAASSAAAAKPRVASINLCADQLVLLLADPEQIATLSWLAADPEESLLAAEARRHALNYGTAEELLRHAPDVVIAGTYTNDFTRRLLARLGFAVVALEPETDVAGIAANLAIVARAIGQEARGERLIAAMHERRAHLEATRPAERPAAVVVRPGGFTVGADSLAHELLELAGVRNVAAEQGLDRWGSLSAETLVRSRPELIVFTGYRADQPSLANAALLHPALARLARSRPTVTVPTAYWACGLPQSLDSVEMVRQPAP